MRRVAAVGWLVLVGCSPGAVGEAPGRPIELPGVGLRMSVPEDSGVVARADGVHVTLHPRSRHPRELVIAAGGEEAAFRVRSTDAGMGGMQHELRGTTVVAGQRVTVRCTEVREDGPDLEWCWATLATLQQ